MQRNLAWLISQSYINYCQERITEARRHRDVVTVSIYQRRIEKMMIYIGNHQMGAIMTSPIMLNRKTV